MVYEVGVFDFASSCLMLEYAVAIYSSSSLGIDGDSFLAAEMYALSTKKGTFSYRKNNTCKRHIKTTKYNYKKDAY